MNHSNGLTQLRKNWSVVAFILTVVFFAGIVWSFTQGDYIERREFEAVIRRIDENLETIKELMLHEQGRER